MSFTKKNSKSIGFLLLTFPTLIHSKTTGNFSIQIRLTFWSLREDWREPFLIFGKRTWHSSLHRKLWLFLIMISIIGLLLLSLVSKILWIEVYNLNKSKPIINRFKAFTKTMSKFTFWTPFKNRRKSTGF